jgi:hypothetical protein
MKQKFLEKTGVKRIRNYVPVPYKFSRAELLYRRVIGRIFI